MENQVTVDLIEKRPDGTLGIGNSHECELAEAVAMIHAKEAKHPTHPIGVVPDEWQEHGAKDAE
jgi:hypothetical protein